MDHVFVPTDGSPVEPVLSLFARRMMIREDSPGCSPSRSLRPLPTPRRHPCKTSLDQHRRLGRRSRHLHDRHRPAAGHRRPGRRCGEGAPQARRPRRPVGRLHAARHADERTPPSFRYVLTTYHVDVPALKIAPLIVRYYLRPSGPAPGGRRRRRRSHGPGCHACVPQHAGRQRRPATRCAMTAASRRARAALAQPTIGAALIVVVARPGRVMVAA